MATIRAVSQFDSEYWLKFRQQLFPSKSQSEHMLDIQHYFYYPDFKQAFVAELNNKIIGFIEIAIRDSFEGSTLTPVAVIEAWFVDPANRQQGIGKNLIQAAERWAKSKGCKQLASAASAESSSIKLAYEHSGFRNVSSLNHYIKTLNLSAEESADPVGVTLETNRLIVREAQFKDIDTIVDYLVTNKAFHAPFEAPRPHNYYTKAYWQQRIYSNYYRPDEDKTLQLFMFTKDEPNKAIGYANYYNIIYGAFYSCHVGYMMAESAQGHGYMKEALKVGIQYLFKTKNLHRIQANYMPKNKRSGKTLQSLGFEIEGKAKNFLFVNGKWEDHILTSLTNTEW
jgi:ribosomal-protein-alanine N-acetyltransferase